MSCLHFLDCGSPYFCTLAAFLLPIIIFFAVFLLQCLSFSHQYMSVLYKLRALFQRLLYFVNYLLGLASFTKQSSFLNDLKNANSVP